MIFITKIVTTSAQNCNEAKAINKNVLLSEKTYREKLIESLIEFVNFMLFDNQFAIDIQSELIIRDENTMIH